MEQWKKNRWKLAFIWGAVPVVGCIVCAFLAGESDTRLPIIALGLGSGVALMSLIGFSRPSGRDR